MDTEKKDVKFAEGINFYKPGEKSPDFIKGNIVIDKEKLSAWLAGLPNNIVRIDLKKSAKGNLYLSLNSWEPLKTADPSKGEVDIKDDF